LGIDGVRRMVRDIRLMEMSLGKEDLFIQPEIIDVKLKLERSIAAKRDLQQGESISENDIHLLSPGTGFKWHDKSQVIGKNVLQMVSRNEIILPEHLEF